LLVVLTDGCVLRLLCRQRLLEVLRDGLVLRFGSLLSHPKLLTGQLCAKFGCANGLTKALCLRCSLGFLGG